MVSLSNHEGRSNSAPLGEVAGVARLSQSQPRSLNQSSGRIALSAIIARP